MKSLMQYIQGSRKGKEAHRLEKEAMKDPFLSDALDGFQAVKGNHVESIEEMRRRISHRTRSHRDSITKWRDVYKRQVFPVFYRKVLV